MNRGRWKRITIVCCCAIGIVMMSCKSRKGSDLNAMEKKAILRVHQAKTQKGFTIKAYVELYVNRLNTRFRKERMEKGKKGNAQDSFVEIKRGSWKARCRSNKVCQVSVLIKIGDDFALMALWSVGDIVVPDNHYARMFMQLGVASGRKESKSAHREE